MSAEELLRAGNLDGAQQELQQRIRREPANASHRVFLFQLFAVTGQWDRAKTQLQVLRDLDPKTIPMVQAYSQALRCEVLRAEVWRGSRTPLVFGQPEEWIAGMVQAAALSANGKVAEAQAMRAQALDQAQPSAGRIEIADPGKAADPKAAPLAQPFTWIADADPRLGPLLEAVVNGKYYWVPWTAIASLTFEAPADLRDFVWLPATVKWQNGGDAVALLPARYPGSETAANAALRLGKRTEWSDAGHDEFRGSGQKLLATDGGEFAMLDVRRITIDKSA
jgi:type VI secretion system protein ImpE